MLMALLSACSPAAADTEGPPLTPRTHLHSYWKLIQEEEALSDAEVEAQDAITVDVIKQLAEAYTRVEKSAILANSMLKISPNSVLMLPRNSASNVGLTPTLITMKPT